MTLLDNAKTSPQVAERVFRRDESSAVIRIDEAEVEMVETFDGAEPAVILEDSGEVEPEPAWTFRYLVPTFLALTLIGIGVTGYRWYQLRSKYQVVE